MQNDDFAPSHQDITSDGPYTSYVRDAMLKIYKNYGGKFSTDKVSVIHGWDETVRNSKDIKLVLSTDLTTTWLQEPLKGEPDGEGFWSKDNLSALNKASCIPKEFSKAIPKRLPFKFELKNAEKYFTAPVLAESGKNVTLPSIIFALDTVKMPLSDNHRFEYYGRQSVFESEITHNLLDLNSDIILSISEAFNSLDLSSVNQEIVSTLNESFVNLADTNRLAIQSNYRAKAYAIASCTKAKLNLRDSVLKKFKGDNSTKEALRGSNFFTNSLFGPLPKSLMEKLDSYSNRSEAKLTPITFQKFNKRKSDSTPNRGVNKPKRANYGNQRPYNHYNQQYNQSSDRGGYSDYSTNPSSGSSKYATNSLFQNQPPQPQRGRGRKGKGSRKY